MMNAQIVPPSRKLAGFVAAIASILAFYAFVLWPGWGLTLVVGGPIVLLLVAAIGWPALSWLKAKGMLTIYATAAVGAILAVLLPFFLVALSLFSKSPTTISSDHIGLLLLFFALPGAISAAIGWLVAAGFRTRIS